MSVISSDNNQTLKEIQKHNYAILREIDRVCRENHIHYFLHGGTLLGAIRHKDFIPWDDDVDLVFPRKEYERFVQIFPEVSKAGFQLLEPSDYKEFFSFITSIADETLTVPTQRGDDAFYSYRYSHPMVDLFVFDEVGKGFAIQSILLRVIYGIATGHRKAIDFSHYKGIYRLGAHILPMTGKVIPMKVLCHLYQMVATWGNSGKGTYYFISNEQPEPPHWGKFYKKVWFKKNRKETIRKGKFRCANSAEEELAMMYGSDYMEFPPKEKQRPEHFVTNGEYPAPLGRT